MVVRRIVPGETGPSGGPAYADVLGVCRSWSDGVAVLERESGEEVAIPVEEIVTGKPVPPRASVRARVSARDAELHTAGLFPRVEAHPLGEWSIRWEPEVVGRLRRRANSCLAMGSPGMPLPAALERVVEFYTARGRRPILQVEQGSEVEDHVRAAGWEPIHGDALFLLASVAMLGRQLRPTAGLTRVEAGGPRVLATVPGPGIAARAFGRASLDGDWLGIHDVLVDPAHRRQGLAREVIAALLEWGAEQGARTIWLHVETSNEPARALYDSLGFTEHHRCRYYERPS